MKTFFNILQTLIGITNKKYPDDPFTIHDNVIYFCDNIHIIFLINNIFFKQKECANQREYNKNVISKNAFVKFTCLNNILQNIFYTFELKETIFNIFSRAQKYYHAFQGEYFIKGQSCSIEGHAYHLYILEVENRLGLYNYLKQKNIFAQVHYIPCHLMPYYKENGWKEGDFPKSENYYKFCISIPMFPSITDEDVDFVIKAIKSFYA